MSWSLGYQVVLSKSRTCLLSAAFLTSRKPKPPCFSQSVTRSSGNFCIPQVKPHLFCTAGCTARVVTSLGKGQGQDRACSGLPREFCSPGRGQSCLGGLLQEQLWCTELGCSQWDHLSLMHRAR